uniref:Exocyst complex component Sec10 n=1 Tax=Ascaris lumbricoides TaxID=6252 RepID=A0A0M3ISW2_ASCLU
MYELNEAVRYESCVIWIAYHFRFIERLDDDRINDKFFSNYTTIGEAKFLEVLNNELKLRSEFLKKAAIIENNRNRIVDRLEQVDASLNTLKGTNTTKDARKDVIRGISSDVRRNLKSVSHIAKEATKAERIINEMETYLLCAVQLESASTMVICSPSENEKKLIEKALMASFSLSNHFDIFVKWAKLFVDKIEEATKAERIINEMETYLLCAVQLESASTMVICSPSENEKKLIEKALMASFSLSNHFDIFVKWAKLFVDKIEFADTERIFLIDRDQNSRVWCVRDAIRLIDRFNDVQYRADPIRVYKDLSLMRNEAGEKKHILVVPIVFCEKLSKKFYHAISNEKTITASKPVDNNDDIVDSDQQIAQESANPDEGDDRLLWADLQLAAISIVEVYDFGIIFSEFIVSQIITKLLNRF